MVTGQTLGACFTTSFITGDSAFGNFLMKIRSKILEICQIFIRILDQIWVKTFLKIEILVIKEVRKHHLKKKKQRAIVEIAIFLSLITRPFPDRKQGFLGYQSIFNPRFCSRIASSRGLPPAKLYKLNHTGATSYSI